MLGADIAGIGLGAIGVGAGIGLTAGALGMIGQEVNQIVPNAEEQLRSR